MSNDDELRAMLETVLTHTCKEIAEQRGFFTYYTPNPAYVAAEEALALLSQPPAPVLPPQPESLRVNDKVYVATGGGEYRPGPAGEVVARIAKDYSTRFGMLHKSGAYLVYAADLEKGLTAAITEAMCRLPSLRPQRGEVDNAALNKACLIATCHTVPRAVTHVIIEAYLSALRPQAAPVGEVIERVKAAIKNTAKVGGESHHWKTMRIQNLEETARAALSAIPAVQGVGETAAARDVLAERKRQVEKEGWTPEHDDEHDGGEIALAAARYAAHPVEIYADMEVPCGCRSAGDCPHAAFPKTERVEAWPWDRKWWKPGTARRNLVKAGALILAEIERLDRAAPQAAGEEA